MRGWWQLCARLAKRWLLARSMVCMAGRPGFGPGKAAEAGRHARPGARGSQRSAQAPDSQQPEEQEQPGCFTSPSTAHCSAANRSTTSFTCLHVHCWLSRLCSLTLPDVQSAYWRTNRPCSFCPALPACKFSCCCTCYLGIACAVSKS